jgi:hypothetical protein
LNVPVIVAEVCDDEEAVETVNVALVAPEGIVTELGTVAEEELLDRETAMPALGAAEPIVAVPVEVAPPATVVGDREIELRLGGAMDKVAVAVVPPVVAVIVDDVLVGTATVETVKVAVFAPDATVTELGTVADDELLERFTV